MPAALAAQRPMARSFNEQLADRAASHAIDLLRFEAQARAQILGFLEQLKVEIEAKVRGFLRDGESAQAKRLRAESLLRQVEETIATAYGDAADAHEEVLTGLARVEGASAASNFRSVAIAADLDLNVLTAQQLRAIASDVLIENAPSRSWWAAQAGDTLERFKQELREGLALGETTDDIVRRIRGSATGRRNTYELNGKTYTYVEFRGGVLDTSTRHARALVRTSVQAVASTARRSTFEENQDVVKGLVQISVFDLRTTTTCLAYGGKAWSLPDYAPIDHDLPYLGGVPRHWGAIPKGEPILTARGALPIEHVRVGDFVVTHRGRYRRVYATMAKPGGPLPLVGIETESGRILWATQEHPVLTVGRGWQRADQIRAGDELLEHPKQAVESGLRLRRVLASEDCPTVFEEERFFAGVAFGAGEVPPSIDFECDPRFHESEVNDPALDRILEHERQPRLMQGAEYGALVGLRVGAVDGREGDAAPAQALGVLGGVAVAEHPGAMNAGELRARLGVARSPVRSSARPLDLRQSEAKGVHAGAQRNPMASARGEERRVSEAEAALDRAHRLAIHPVCRTDQALDLRTVGEIQVVPHWHASRVRRVIVASDTRDVYNLAVVGDETYLSGGFIVHNCRSTEAPVLRSWEELGIDLRDAPRGARWSRLDGDVPTDFSMDDFLERRSDAQVDEMLGPGVAELWRSHRLSLEDLVDSQTGRPLTLAELELRYGAAA